MDPVTHVAAGVLLGQAARDKFPAWRWLVPLTAFSAWLPDIDNVVMIFGPEAYMRYHRGYTHSLLGGLALAWLLAWGAGKLRRDLPRLRLFILLYLGVLSHLFLDVITSYGTRVFLPFSNARVALSSVFIVDPAFTVVLILLAAASFWRPAWRRAFAGAGLAVMLAYPAANLGVRAIAATRAEALLAERGEHVSRLTVQPDALAPLWWKVIATEGDEYVLTGLDLRRPDRLLPERHFIRAERGEMEKLGEQAPVFPLYAWFTDFPVQSVTETPEGETVTFQDLRFMAVNPLVARVRGPVVPFTLTAVLDAAGNLEHASYSQMGKKELILPRRPFQTGANPAAAGLFARFAALFQ